jgi:hypothetical protein
VQEQEQEQESQRLFLSIIESNAAPARARLPAPAPAVFLPLPCSCPARYKTVSQLEAYLLALWNLWAIASISLSTRLPYTTLSDRRCREWDLELRS